MKLLHRVDRRVADDGAAEPFFEPGVALRRAASRQIDDVQTVERDLILIDARARGCTLTGYARLHGEQRGGIVALLYGKVVEFIYVEGVANVGVGRIDGDFRVGSRHFDMYLGAGNRELDRSEERRGGEENRD